MSSGKEKILVFPPLFPLLIRLEFFGGALGEQLKIRESGMPDEEIWASFFDPDRTLERLGCDAARGNVAEFGCGYGLFTLAAARIVSGTVFALDIEPDMVALTSEKARGAGLENVVAIQRDFLAEGSGLPDQSCDYAMLFNILHLEEPVTLLREAKRVLAPSGLVGIMHWNYDPSTPRGPSMEIRPRPEQCAEWAIEAGFRVDRYEDLPCCPYHYGIVAFN